jgi:hypothetical protein
LQVSFFDDVQMLISNVGSCFAGSGRDLAGSSGCSIFFGIGVEAGTTVAYAGAGSLGYLISTRDGSKGFFKSICGGFVATAGASVGIGGVLGVMFDGDVTSYAGIGVSLQVEAGEGLGAGVTASVGVSGSPTFSLSMIVGTIAGVSVSLVGCGTSAI